MCTNCKTGLVFVQVKEVLWPFSFYSCGTASLFHLVSHTHTDTQLLQTHRGIASCSILSCGPMFVCFIEMVNNAVILTCKAAHAGFKLPLCPTAGFCPVLVQTYRLAESTVQIYAMIVLLLRSLLKLFCLEVQWFYYYFYILVKLKVGWSSLFKHNLV